ncbi:hypothetical protein [Streptomyces sp. RKAG290]|uniref:hypothetical protein n=1 Tax=Streptomyces sp. RKAG290 TaxID=2888348 RepID=UPI0027E31A9E|nr:hypothetical protein [Streptomyces sp. RKAG290]
MRRQTFVRTGRRGTVIAASAAVLCLGGALAACGAGADGGDGYVAVGAAGARPQKAPTGAVAPTGKVTLIPLDGERGGSADRDPEPGSAAAGGAPAGKGGTGGGTGGDAGSASGGTQSPSGSGGAGGSSGSSGSSGSGANGGSSGSSAAGGGGAAGGDGSGAAPAREAVRPTRLPPRPPAPPRPQGRRY